MSAQQPPFAARGSPDEVSETNGFRWGFGAGFPSRKSLRFTAELTGEKYFKDSLTTKTLLTATDGSPITLQPGNTWEELVPSGIAVTTAPGPATALPS